MVMRVWTIHTCIKRGSPGDRLPVRLCCTPLDIGLFGIKKITPWSTQGKRGQKNKNDEGDNSIHYRTNSIFRVMDDSSVINLQK